MGGSKALPVSLVRLDTPEPGAYKRFATTLRLSADFEYLAGHLTFEVSGRLVYRGETDLAGLEIGHRPSQGEAAEATTARQPRVPFER